MQNTRAQNREKLQRLLRELFQFDVSDLDFGIYRILNYKRDEIERFIERDLLDAVEEGLAGFQAAERSEIEARLAEKRQQLGDAALDENGAVREQFRSIPIAQEYMKLYQQLRQLQIAEETEARIFNDLYRFFARYYDNGDFLTERRYSSQEPKFAVPYNGEEVLLHWANRDQYYVKTSERFTDYRFKVGDYTIWFRLDNAEVPADNIKGNTRYFVLRDTDPLEYDAEEQVLTVHFEYRPLTEEEEAHYLAIYNEQQPKSSRRKTLDRSVLVEALEAEIMAQLGVAEVKHALARPHGAAETARRTELGYHLNRYTARNTMDYFVHKDLGGFLRRELDFFLKNEVLNVDDFLGDPSGEALQFVISRARVVRLIGEKIIAFLAQIEDFQKRLFEKKKFVVQTDYCITLDRAPEEFYPEILENEQQLAEWRRLYNMDAWDRDLFWNGSLDLAFLKNHPYLMLDTAFFDAGFKGRLLATFDDLDAATDGVLIHGENFQALNLLQAKYGGQVKCIYIDPPYNTGSDGFLYKDKYQHSSWLSMMENRLALARRVLSDEGMILISIDDRELENLLRLSDQIFGPDAHISTLVWNTEGHTDNQYDIKVNHEYVLAYARDRSRVQVGYVIDPNTREESNLWKGYAENSITKNGPANPPSEVLLPAGFPVAVEEIHLEPNTPPDAFFAEVNRIGYITRDLTREYNVTYPVRLDPMIGEDSRLIELCRVFSGWANVDKLRRFINNDFAPLIEEDGEISFYLSQNGVIYYRKERDKARNIYSVLRNMGTTERMGSELESMGLRFDYPKPKELIRYLLQIGADEGGIALDFFAGSGTIAHSAMDLNREGDDQQYILVEMGEYFDTVLKPRIQKVAFSANWKEGVPQDRDGMSHIFKYQRLESYEDALNNIRVRPPAEPQLSLLYDEFDDYMLSYMLDFETRDSPTLLTQDAFETPFDYKLDIQRGHESPQPTTVDLVETFHYLLGMHVRRLERHQHQDRKYVVSRGEVRTEHGIESVAVIWRDRAGLDLEQEANWVHSELLPQPVDRVYVNSESFIDKAEPLEFAFRDRMEASLHAK